MENEKDSKNYELAVLVKTEDELAGIAAFLGQHEATITGEPRVKKIALAYPVKKQREAVFASYLFSALPANAKALEKDLNLRQEVLRSMIIIPPAPQAGEGSRFAGVESMGRRPMRAPRAATAPTAPKPAAPITNEALEKKIEEILK